MATEVGTGDRSDPSICPSSCRFDSGRGPRRLADQFRPLHVACGRAQLPSGRDRRARRIRRSGPHAGDGGNGVRICGRHGALRRRRGGNAVFPVRLLHLLFRSARQPDRLHSLFVHGDQPDHHHRRAGADRLFHRRHRRGSRITGCSSSRYSFRRACRSTFFRWSWRSSSFPSSSRPVSHSVRLFANMLAGHITL